jgi:hypothetical protein
LHSFGISFYTISMLSNIISAAGSYFITCSLVISSTVPTNCYRKRWLRRLDCASDIALFFPFRKSDFSNAHIHSSKLKPTFLNRLTWVILYPWPVQFLPVRRKIVWSCPRTILPRLESPGLDSPLSIVCYGLKSKPLMNLPCIALCSLRTCGLWAVQYLIKCYGREAIWQS